MKKWSVETDEVIELADFIAYADEHLEPRDEDSISAMAPKLVALARNRRFLARFMIEALANPARYQEGNTYTGPAVMLGGGRGYFVRAVGWPAIGEEMKTPSDLGVHTYDGEAQVAHTHNFTILTTGYAGPGYETDVYEWVRDGHEDPLPDERVHLDFVGRHRLTQGTVMQYRAFDDAHIQYPPARYSTSLNLLVHPSEEDLRDQLFFDVEKSTVVMAGGRGNDKRVQLIDLAAAVGDPSFAPHLEIIANEHPAPRVRARGRRALDAIVRGA